MGSTFVDRLGWTLVHFVWEGALVAILLAIMLWLAPQASSRSRYSVACLALLVVAAFPVATFVYLGPTSPNTSEISSGLKRTVEETTLLAPKVEERLMPILVALWALGVALLSIRLLGSLLQVERWKRRYTRLADPDWQRRVDDLAKRLGVKRSIKLLVSERIEVPSAWGVLKSIVVFPASLLTQLPVAQVETILLHEIAHIRRHDYLINLLQTVVEAVLFYHPAVWWVSAIVRREREHCCDDVVVGLIPDPMPYARALLHLEERRHSLPQPTLSATGSKLMNRIARILGRPSASARFSPLTSSLAAVAVLGAVLGGTLQARAQVAKPKPKAAPAVVAPATNRVAPAVVAKTAPLPRFRKVAAAKPAPVLLPLARKTAISDLLLAQSMKKAQEKAMQREASDQMLAKLIASELQKAQVEARLRAMIDQKNRAVRDAKPATDEEIGSGVQLNDGKYVIDVKDAEFVPVIRRLAQVSGMQIVIRKGNYADVSIVITGKSLESAIQILCKAADATYRMEGDVYYFTAK